MSDAGRQYLLDKLTDTIDYVRLEYDMTYTELIGCLEVVKHSILVEGSIDEDEDVEGNDSFAG